MLLVGIGCMAGVMFVFIENPYAISSELALHLDMARMLLDGQKPYVDFLDALLPSMTFFCALPALISAVFKTDIVLTGIWSVFILSVLSTSAVIAVLAKSELADKPLVIGCFVAAYAAMNNLFFLQFGEREHLLVLLALPYVLIRWLRSTDSSVQVPIPLAICAGIAAGFGFSIDFLFLAIPLILEFALLLQTNRLVPFKTAEIAGLGFALLLLPLYFVIQPASAQTYFGQILPVCLTNLSTEMDDAVRYFGCSPEVRVFIYIMVLAFIFALALRKETSLFYPLMILSMAGFTSYILDKRGATGQIILMMVPAFAIWSILVALPASALAKKWRVILSVVLVAISFSGLAIWEQKALAKAYRLRPRTTRFNCLKLDGPQEFSVLVSQLTEPGDKIMFFNDTITPGYPLTLIMNRQAVGPWLWSFPIRIMADRKVLAADGAPEYTQGPMRKFDDQFVEDKLSQLLEDKVPKLLFIQDGRTENYLYAHPRIDAAVHQKYEKVADANHIVDKSEPMYTTGNWWGFSVWKRKE